MLDGLPPGQAELVLMASVARRYFIDGDSKTEIGEQLGLSRFKVARLLEKARAVGLVQIEIRYAGTVDIETSTRLQRALGLRHAVVVDVPEDDHAELLDHLGTAAAELLAEAVGPDDVLGLAWARSVTAVCAALTRLAPCAVVQLTGVLAGPEPYDSPTELVRAAARTGGGTPYYFHAPMIVPDAATARSLRRQPEVARAMSRYGAVTTAVVGVGAWNPPFSTVHDAIDVAERDSLRRRGVVAEICGILLDAQGGRVTAPLTQRVIAVDADQLRAVPDVIAVAYGPDKAAAVTAGVRAGLIDGIVTHRSLAERLLA